MNNSILFSNKRRDRERTSNRMNYLQ